MKTFRRRLEDVRKTFTWCRLPRLLKEVLFKKS